MVRGVAAVAIAATGLALAAWLWDGAAPERATSSRRTAEELRTTAGGARPPEPERRARRGSTRPGDREPVPIETRAERSALPVPPLYEESLSEARKWFERRREARKQDDEKAEEEARREWDVSRRRLLNAVRANGREARRFLAWLGTLDDDRDALYLARVLPFVFVEGFEEHLIATATGDGPVLERRAAPVGLRARGLAAATATGEVAAQARETALRADASSLVPRHAGFDHVGHRTGNSFCVARDARPSANKSPLSFIRGLAIADGSLTSRTRSCKPT